MKQQVESIIQNFISSTEKSYPSIYSRVDVIVLLNDILFKVHELEEVEVEKIVGEKTYTMEELNIAIDDMRVDTLVDIDYDTAEFELNGNEISVTEIDYSVDNDEIRKQIFKQLGIY
jgi:hypothetical protein